MKKLITAILLFVLPGALLPQQVIFARFKASAGAPVPVLGTWARGGDALACYHTLTCSVTITPTAGQPIFVGFATQGQTGITGVTDTCNTGSTSNTYTQQTTVLQSYSSTTLSTYTAISGAGASCTVTMTVAGASSYEVMVAAPITGANSGVGPSNTAQGLNSGTGANAVATASFTTTTANNLIVTYACDMQGSTGTFIAGTSPVASTLNFSYYNGNYSCALEYGTQATAATITGTITESVSGATNYWAVASVSFKP